MPPKHCCHTALVVGLLGVVGVPPKHYCHTALVVGLLGGGGVPPKHCINVSIKMFNTHNIIYFFIIITYYFVHFTLFSNRRGELLILDAELEYKYLQLRLVFDSRCLRCTGVCACNTGTMYLKVLVRTFYGWIYR